MGRDRKGIRTGKRIKIRLAGVGGMGNHKKVPDARNSSSTQDPVRMTLAKISNSREKEPEETTSSRETWPSVGGWGHTLMSKF